MIGKRVEFICNYSFLKFFIVVFSPKERFCNRLWCREIDFFHYILELSHNLHYEARDFSEIKPLRNNPLSLQKCCKEILFNSQLIEKLPFFPLPLFIKNELSIKYHSMKKLRDRKIRSEFYTFRPGDVD